VRVAREKDAVEGDLPFSIRRKTLTAWVEQKKKEKATPRNTPPKRGLAFYFGKISKESRKTWGSP